MTILNHKIMKPAEMVRQAISNDELFEQHSRKIAQETVTNKLSFTKDVVASIKKQIKDKNTGPPEKLRALNLLHICMMERSPHVLQFAQKKVMSRLRIFASFQKESADESRGKSIFGAASLYSDENMAASAQFLTNLLNYIKMWAAQYPTNPDGKLSEYSKTYVHLQKCGVRFPGDAPLNQRPRKHTNQPPNPHNAHRMSMPARSAPQQPRVNVPGLVDAIQNNLALGLEISSSPNPDPELVREIKASLQKNKLEVELVLNHTENPEDIEVLFSLNDQVQEFLSNVRDPQVSPQQIPQDFYSQSYPQAYPQPSQFASQQPQQIDLLGLDNSQDDEIAQLNGELNKLNQQLATIQAASAEKEGMIKKLTDTIVEMRGGVAVKEPDEPLNPFDSSSSSDEEAEEVKAEPLEIANAQSCRLCFCYDKGILYEDPQVQIGIQIGSNENMVIANMYLGNKASEPITEVLTEIQGFATSQIDKIASTDVVQYGQQTNRTLQFAFNLNQISKLVPSLKVTIQRSVTQKLLLRLPISIVRLFKASAQDPSTVLTDWNSLMGMEKPVPVFLDSINSMTELATHVAFAGAFAVFSNQQIPDLGKSELMSVGVLGEIKVVIKVSIGSSTKAMLKIRCQDTTLRDALCGLLAEQLTGKIS